MAYEGNTYKGEPVRIAEVLGNAATGGVMNWLMNFYRHVDRSRIQFDFYMYAPSAFDDEIRSLGGRVFYYPEVVTHVFGAVKVLTKACPLCYCKVNKSIFGRAGPYIAACAAGP